MRTRRILGNRVPVVINDMTECVTESCYNSSFIHRLRFLISLNYLSEHKNDSVSGSVGYAGV